MPYATDFLELPHPGISLRPKQENIRPRGLSWPG